MSKRKNPEADFSREFGGSWKVAGGDWYKIPDNRGPMSMFSPKRPYDVHAAMGGDFFTIETKVPKSFRLRLKDFKSHQIPALLNARKHGYQAYALACYDHKSYNKKIADFFSVDVLEALRLSGRDEVPHEYAAMRVYKLRGVGWDIHPEQIKDMIGKKIEVTYEI